MPGKKTKSAPLIMENLTDYRFLLAETQAEFWSLYGVMQSNGSRYESGLAMPLSVAMLMIIRAEGMLDDEQLNRARALALEKINLFRRSTDGSRRSTDRAAKRGPLKAPLAVKQVTVHPERRARTGPRRRSDRP